MKSPFPSNIWRRLGATLGVALLLALTPPPQIAVAEDIDLFVNAAATSSTRPNILIILDNSANWNSNAQHWPAPAGSTSTNFKQGQSELRAIRTVLASLDGNNPTVNMGLMMFMSGSTDGAIVRFGIRTMNTVNIAALTELIGTATDAGDSANCYSGSGGSVPANNSLNGTPNCILQKYKDNGEEMTNSASTSYSGGLFDAYKYFGGWTSPAYANLENASQVTTPTGQTQFGTTRYFGGPAVSRMDPDAYNSDKTNYASPITSPCAKNYIIFIGNGFPSQDTGGTLLQNVNLGTTPLLPDQLAMQNFTTITTNQVDNLGTNTSCTSTAACAAAAAATYGDLYTSGSPLAQTYACTGGTTVGTPTTIGIDSVCETVDACITRASGTTGYTSYSCSGGTNITAGTTSLAASTTCENLADCQARAATTHGTTYNSYTCSGGIATGDVLSTNFQPTTCQTSSDCETAAAVTGTGTFGGMGYTSFTCSSGNGSGCSGASKKGWTVSGSISGCSASGSKRMNWAVTGTTTGCVSPNFINQTMTGSTSCTQNMTITGTKAVTTVTLLPTFTTPSGGNINYADEWAQFLYRTDVSSLPGQQNVTTFTIDVFKDAQDAKETALLRSMAKYGGGRYFEARNEAAIIDALRQILIEIQSVNSVFASASLPINATNRSQNENQVFIGMFRPATGAKPRWYGNLKRYQIAKFGQEFKLADASTPPLDAVSTQTGFVQACAKSFWTLDSGPYWLFENGTAGACSTSTLSLFSDSPDGPQVEKGAVAEVLRRGNNPPGTAGEQSPMPALNRTIYTCVNQTSCCASPATCTGANAAAQAVELVAFNSTNVSKTQLGDAAMNDTLYSNIINYTLGYDYENSRGTGTVTDIRPTIHGDVAHSRPLPVNFGTTPAAGNASSTTGVVLFYGANDGALRAVSGTNGKELWAFFASEQHSKLKRLTENTQQILYTGQIDPPAGATSKDYFFDGSAGLFQNSDNSKVWLYPTMRRGGRMVYAFDVTDPATPKLKWRLGCSNATMSDTASCRAADGSAGFTALGQTWSIPAVALIKGYGTDTNDPLLIMGGGYDSCDDQDAAPNTSCTSRKGNAVYVINANTGALVKTFDLTAMFTTASDAGSVPSDVTLVDRDADGFVDHAYVADTKGNFYRIDFVDPATPTTTRTVANWTINRTGYTSGGNRKFLFPPAVLPSGGKLYVTNTTGDRERPLIINYPYLTPVTNKAYMLVDDLTVYTDISIATSFTRVGTAVDMDGASMFNATTTDSGCIQGSAESQGKKGWYFNLNNGNGEQGVTSSIIFGGLVFFSTNRPVATPPGACANDLGEARGYAVNLLTASGAVGTEALCGGTRSGTFIGGGLPPSPVTGVVPVDGVPVTVMIGGIQRTGGSSSAIGSQRVKPVISQKRSRIYWYRDGDK